MNKLVKELTLKEMFKICNEQINKNKSCVECPFFQFILPQEPCLVTELQEVQDKKVKDLND